MNVDIAITTSLRSILRSEIMDKKEITENLYSIETEGQYILYSKKPREIKEFHVKNIKVFPDEIKYSLEEGD